MRHGKALSAAESGASEDAERILSDIGKKDSITSSKKLAETGFRPGIILTSPLVRAVQTAEILSGIFEVNEIEITRFLDGSRPPGDILKILLERLETAHSLIAVGHQPSMGFMAQSLTGQVIKISAGGFVMVKFKPVPKTGKEAPAEILKVFNP